MDCVPSTLQTHGAPQCTAQCRELMGGGSRGTDGSPAVETSEKKQVGRNFNLVNCSSVNLRKQAVGCR